MSECFCDYEPADVYSATTQRARKTHRCDECGRAIQAGDVYERAFMVYQGDADVYKTCPRCMALREFVRAHVPCFCWAHGNMIEDAMGTADHYAHETDGLLFGAWRRKVLIDRAPAFVKPV